MNAGASSSSAPVTRALTPVLHFPMRIEREWFGEHIDTMRGTVEVQRSGRFYVALMPEEHRHVYREKYPDVREEQIPRELPLPEWADVRATALGYRRINADGLLAVIPVMFGTGLFRVSYRIGEYESVSRVAVVRFTRGADGVVGDLVLAV